MNITGDQETILMAFVSTDRSSFVIKSAFKVPNKVWFKPVLHSYQEAVIYFVLNNKVANQIA